MNDGPAVSVVYDTIEDARSEDSIVWSFLPGSSPYPENESLQSLNSQLFILDFAVIDRLDLQPGL
jgi:hypothetical protein